MDVFEHIKDVNLGDTLQYFFPKTIVELHDLSNGKVINEKKEDIPLYLKRYCVKPHSVKNEDSKVIISVYPYGED